MLRGRRQVVLITGSNRSPSAHKYPEPAKRLAKTEMRVPSRLGLRAAGEQRGARDSVVMAGPDSVPFRFPGRPRIARRQRERCLGENGSR
jgi:hypothetical protein